MLRDLSLQPPLEHLRIGCRTEHLRWQMRTIFAVPHVSGCRTGRRIGVHDDPLVTAKRRKFVVATSPIEQ